MPSYDLVTEPWIPCAPLTPTAPGAPRPLSLRDALVLAHEQRELVDDSPLVTVALHRLLLALLHRIYRGPASVEEWRVIQRAGRFDISRIDRYLTTWHPRFDLFDEKHPFYQVPLIEEVKSDGTQKVVEPGSIAKLAHEKSNGVTLFDHTTQENVAFTSAEAARYLTAFQQFAIAGGVSTPFNLSDGPLTRDYTVLVRGETLFETLLFNMVQYDRNHPFEWRGADDPPWWERDTHPTPDRNGTPPTGYLDYLTWQSRRVHLLYDQASGRVRQAQVRQNLKLTTGEYDPFKAYRKSKDEGWFSLRLSEQRAVWRDSHALFEVAVNASDASERRPKMFDWLVATTPGIGLNKKVRQVDFDVLGSLNDGAQAIIILWRRDSLPLPLVYLVNQDLRDRLRDALALAEDTSKLFTAGFYKVERKSYPRPLRILAGRLLTGTSGRDADAGEVRNLIKHLGAEQAYWAALEPHFREFIVDLATAMEPGGADGREGGRLAMRTWADRAVDPCARSAFRSVRAQFDMSARSLRAIVDAERAFNYQLRELLDKNAERFAAPTLGVAVAQPAQPAQ